MKFVSNAGSDRVLDLIRPWLKPNHRMDMVSPSFSLYAFFEVLTELPHLSNARLVVPPTSTTPTKGTEQEQLKFTNQGGSRFDGNGGSALRGNQQPVISTFRSQGYLGPPAAYSSRHPN